MNLEEEYNEEILIECLSNWAKLGETSNQLLYCIKLDLEAGLSELEERDRLALTYYYIEDYNQNEVADRLGISQQYLSRDILPNSINKLQKILKEVG